MAASQHHARDRHLRICREDVFGVCPDAPQWLSVPVLGDGFKLKAAAPRYFPDTAMSGSVRTVGLTDWLIVEGSFTTPAWVELAGALLAMALHRDPNGDLSSYTLDFYTPADPRRILGAVAETLTIVAGGAGPADVRLTLGLRAKTEEANPALQPEDFDYSGISLVPFAFGDARIELDTVRVTDVQEFRVRVDNNVARGPYLCPGEGAPGVVAYLIAGARAISLTLTALSNDTRFNSAIRNGGTVSFEADLYHPSGHLMQIKLPVLAPETNPESARRTGGAPATEAPTLQAVADTAGRDIIWAVDPGPTTTTLAPLTTSTS